jgi:hypothetical protein
MKAVLEVIGGSSCNECSRKLIHAMGAVANVGHQDTGPAEHDQLYRVTESVPALPIIQEKAAQD